MATGEDKYQEEGTAMISINTFTPPPPPSVADLRERESDDFTDTEWFHFLPESETPSCHTEVFLYSGHSGLHLKG
jgi:hypothetical protein